MVLQGSRAVAALRGVHRPFLLCYPAIVSAVYLTPRRSPIGARSTSSPQINIQRCQEKAVQIVCSVTYRFHRSKSPAFTDDRPLHDRDPAGKGL